MSGEELDNLDDMDPADILARVKITKEPESSEVVLPETARALVVDSTAIRNEFILKYYSMGMTTQTITEMIKAKAAEKGWKAVEERTVRSVISNHYKKRRELFRGVDGKENEKAMQDAMLDQQEKFLEKLIISYNRHERDKTFKNMFDQIQMADLIHRMRQQYIENRNWNESRKNPLVVAESNTFEVNLFESSGEKMIVQGKSSAMENVLDHLRRKFDASNALDSGNDYVEADYEEHE